MQSKYQFFTDYELSCHCGNCGLGPESMDVDFMDKATLMRKTFDFPFIISSSIRCESHNIRVSGSSSSAHLVGRAFDILIYGSRAHKIVSNAEAFGIYGLGISQHGPVNKRIIHIDDITPEENHLRPRVFSYP
jgi:uncharacterized protein YcbK (DUF882 family)